MQHDLGGQDVKGNQWLYYAGTASCLTSAVIAEQRGEDPRAVALFVLVGFAYLILAKLEGMR